MEQYSVEGMSCAACQARVEKAVSALPGVESCAVSLLTNSMGVTGEVAPDDIIAAVKKAGYGASLKNKSEKSEKTVGSMADSLEALKDHETPILKKRLITSLVFLLILMYLSMGHMMLGWPVPAIIRIPASLALTEMLLAIIVMVINKKFFTSGFRTLLERSPNMDTLVALGSSAAFAYSLAVLYLMLYRLAAGDVDGAAMLSHNLYFESAAMIPTLITIGKMLEAMSKGRTTDALKSLMKLAPQTAVIYKDGQDVEVPISSVAVGDVFTVKPGASVPVDGIVIEGTTSVNEAALTGESIPVDKQEGDLVSAATINTSGFIRARATRVGEDTTLSQIINMVSDAAATKAPIARIADKVSGVFVPVVIGIGIITFIIWMIAGQTVSFSIARAIAVLVISCPCALGLATPVAIMVGNGVGAKNGILFKTAAAEEEAGRIDIVALDKTGTITSGQPEVTDIHAVDGVTNDELLMLAASLEKKSEHPLARAVMKKAEALALSVQDVDDFKILPGNGLSATKDGVELLGGSLSYMKTMVEVPQPEMQTIDALASEGKTPLLFAAAGQYFGCIAVADAIRPDSKDAVTELRNMGIEVIMLTGDNARTAHRIAELSGVDRVISDVLPDGKEKVIRELKEQSGGRVAMVGDGINDAPALTRADLGIAIGAGADVAVDAADIVLMKSGLREVPAAIRLSRRTLRNIHENLFWAFFYNLLCIPLAAGFYGAVFGWHWEMSPMIAAATMCLSSFTVCMNALRLNMIDIYDTKRDKAIKKHVVTKQATTEPEEKEKKMMTKTMTIEGMMCGHCEANVKNALSALNGVQEAVVSHTAGTAVVTADDSVTDELLKKTVEDKGYAVKDIK